MGNLKNPITTDEALMGKSTNESEGKMKTPIEIALQIDDDGYTTSRKLYFWLYEKGKHYAQWIKDNVTENPFAEESEFSPILRKPQKQGGRPTEDYKITASLAKRISMADKSERGEQARNYFIGCEQALVRIAEQKHKTEVERAKGIAVRNALTSAIKRSGENERMHNMAYPTYTDLVYRSLFGKSAKQFRDENGLTKKDDLRDLFNTEELQQIQNAEMLVSSLIGYGWGYYEIKDFLMDKKINRIRA